ncbi:VapB protein of antitoxin of type II toxin-antitoxin system [Prosthecobacter fusiformis]|uniref:VapB protein of antitoxin of type II toxin-antitoxin system n=1 Tax=Prosthecobacter fusiformis TaxID=48464 RepID=A0A4R7S6B1_9BACT|nr:type II toxin-antitoxin system VapB family antitoxin [Prosthecobacter fusiformis]TDU72965.1 VapB protein of antitoxin of type II toxin-antitoxin system [Prosthecobacter fusiformis]
MRTTLLLDEELIAKAGRLTGITEKTKLVHMGLEALITRESSRRLAALGGSMPELSVPPRTRPTEERLDLAHLTFKAAEDPKPYGTR